MINDRLHSFDLVLASSSPRRRQLMREAGFTFTVAQVYYHEECPDSLKGKELAESIADAKADAWSSPVTPRQIIITADTVVWCHESVLGKPANDKEAVSFLRMLSGCRHEVITAICLRDNERKSLFSVTTGVTFRELSDEEIIYYVTNYHPYDKAGAYGIQEWIGLRGITNIEGSYYNVMGMPVSDLYSGLLHFTENKTITI